MGQKVKEAAVALAKLGLRVLPVAGVEMLGSEGRCTCARGALCRHPGKHPVGKAWDDRASADPGVVELWDWEGMNVGVAPGEEELAILDFDGPEGLATLEQLGRTLPPLPPGTPVCQTGSGGVHVYLRVKSKNAVRLLPGMDVRGAGGQVVAPPSQHYRGGLYQWLAPPGTGGLPEAPVEWANLVQGVVPDSLRAMEVVTLERLKDLARRRGKLQPALKALVNGEPFAEQGSRDSTLYALCGYLSRRWPYADPDSIADLFAPSLLSMASEPEPPTRADVIEKFTRRAAEAVEKLEARPRVFCQDNIVAMAGEAMEVLSSRSGGLFIRAHQLVHVVIDDVLPGMHNRPEAPPAIEPVPKSVLRGMLTEHMEWTKVKADGDAKPCLPPEPVVEYLHDTSAWKGIRPLEGVTHGPLLRKDGTVFPGGGYDDLTGILSLGPAEELPKMSPEEAIEGLEEAVVDFPFETETDKAAWLAGLLTSVGRDAISGPTPLFLVDANVRGAGKTLLAHTASFIASGAGATPAALGRDEDEDRKVITSLAREGARVVLIDNVTGTFGTAKLCEALTLHSGVWADRVLGTNRTWRGPFAPTWWATSNNVNLAADMARRTCYIRLSSDLERPELRDQFRHPALLGWVAENRRELFHCSLSLLTEYCAAGRPKPEKMDAWGGYEVWSDLVRGAIVWAGLPDPINNREQLLYSDSDHDSGESLVDGFFELVKEKGPLTCQEVIDELYAPGKTVSEMQRYSQLREALDIHNSSRRGNPSAKSLGWLFKRYRGRVFGGKHIERVRGIKKKWFVFDKDGIDMI